MAEPFTEQQLRELDEVHRKVHDLATSATVTVSWPDEQNGAADD